MPRRTGPLPLELAILRVAAGTPEIHGFAVAGELRDRYGAGLTAHGTLYKALSRLASQGLLAARWEPAEVAEEQGRPRRRLYRITDAGRALLVHTNAPASRTATTDAATRPTPPRPVPPRAVPPRPVTS